jgi:hypothetical protein
MDNDEQGCRQQARCSETRIHYRGALPSEMCALLLELESLEDACAKESHNLPHWTSDRDPKKS